MKNQIFMLFLLIGGLLFSKPPKTTTEELVKVADNAILIDESDNNREIQVGGKDVLITGNKNTIHFTGTCNKLVITGKNNDIDADTVSIIVITGDYNFVAWKFGPNGKGKPSIADKGGYNNVGKRSGQALTKEEN